MSETKPLASLSSGLLARKGAARPAMRRQSIVPSAPSSASPQDDLGWDDMGYDVDPPQTAELTAINPDGSGHDDRKVGVLAAAIPEVVKQQDALERQFSEDSAGMDAPSPPAQSQDAVQNNQDVTPAPVSQSPLWSKPVAGEAPEAQPITRQLAAENAESVAGKTEDDEVGQASVSASNILSKKPEKPSLSARNTPVAKTKKRQAKVAKAPAGKRAAFTLRLDPARHLRLRLASALRNQSAQHMVTQALDDFLADFPELDSMTGNLPSAENQTRKSK